MIVYYDSINEVRANNCPPGMFREDYSHYSWYSKVNFFEHYPYFKMLTLPYTLWALTIDIQNQKGWKKFVPPDIPNAEWIQYGNLLHTPEALHNNVERILQMAKTHKTPVLLIGFAFHVPQDYSPLRFKKKTLDYAYGDSAFPIEIWGQATNVIKGIFVHNAVLYKLSQKKTFFWDANSFLPKNGKHFRDICHFTDAGIEAFVSGLGKFLQANIPTKAPALPSL